MELVIASTPEEVGRIAAERIAHLLTAVDRSVLGVATGSSPLETYAHLQEMVGSGALDLSRARVFSLDEYLGLGVGDEQSYAATIRRTVTEPLGLEASQVRTPDGLAADPEAEAAAYEQVIREAGGVDVQLLGIGGNGHIGFNEPGTDPAARTHVGELSEATRTANARFFASPDEVPTHCLTQGLGTIGDARHIVLVATGEAKAAAIAAATEGPVDASCPASFLQHHPGALLVVDEAAAAALSPRRRRA